MSACPGCATAQRHEHQPRVIVMFGGTTYVQAMPHGGSKVQMLRETQRVIAGLIEVEEAIEAQGGEEGAAHG